LYYFRARWYEPVTGRWLSNDPIGISGGLNQYVFCGGNPVNWTDPYGLFFLSGWGWAGAVFDVLGGVLIQKAPVLGIPILAAGLIITSQHINEYASIINDFKKWINRIRNQTSHGFDQDSGYWPVNIDQSGTSGSGRCPEGGGGPSPGAGPGPGSGGTGSSSGLGGFGSGPGPGSGFGPGSGPVFSPGTGSGTGPGFNSGFNPTPSRGSGTPNNPLSPSLSWASPQFRTRP